MRIAIVEHDAAFSRLVRAILTVEGCETIVLASGAGAHAAISEARPDVVILDTWLEDRRSGWNLLQALLLDQSTNHIPIIVATAEVADYKQRMAERQDLATVRLLKKPFAPDQLLATVNEALAEGGAPNGD